MNDFQKTKEQLIEELEALRIRVKDAGHIEDIDSNGDVCVQDRETRHLSILDNSPALICEFLPNGKITFLNKAYCRCFSKTRKELIGTKFLPLIPKEDRETVISNILSLTADAPVKVQEHKVISTDGEIRWQRWTNRGIFDDEGQPVAFHAFGEDVTEQVEAKEELRRKERYLEEAQTLARVGYWTLHPDTQHIDGSDELFRIFGLRREEATLDAFLEVVHPEDREYDLSHIRRGIEHGESWDIEHRLVCRDGTERTVHAKGQAITDETGRVVQLLGTVQDITERKRAEEETRKLAAVVKHSRELVNLATMDGKMIFLNEAGGKMLGIDSGDVERTNIIEVIPEHLMGLVQSELLPALTKGDAWEGDLQYRNLKTGELADVHAMTFSINDPNTNKPLFLANVSLDITERKRAEEEKLALERQLQQTQKLESLGILAGGIAHDFNNLLLVILGNADLALHELSPMSPARDNLRGIEKASKRAAELARQMLAYSGKGRFVVEPIAIGELVEEMAHLLEVSISKKVVLKYNFAENLPPFDGDVTQIRQIVMNLITNASEAIGDKSGVIALSTGAMRCDRAYLDDVNEVLLAGLDEPLCEGIYTYLEVADTGGGMDAETEEKVFDPFFTTKFTGRGLGMSAVLGIVRGHKGALKIYSEVGKGTTLKVLFPANEPADNSLAVRGKDEAAGKDWRGCGTVLIADDEETICALGKQMLELIGFNVLTAADGQEALTVFREHADEIVGVLLDLTMPRMDGAEAFREIRRLRPGVRVILCSGYNEQDATQRFAGKGLAGFIQKPFDVAALRKKLMEVFETGEGEQ
ncbi:PAS domain S-box protein [Candidatus Eisenbacteria bacterium]|uniref:histidine kinase n=1 Tax=Eiseniibacteriota bacterium TaxID=2212470 RepID=A0ABV6YK53_UNCEI